jgi:hypothetical protein
MLRPHILTNGYSSDAFFALVVINLMRACFRMVLRSRRTIVPVSGYRIESNNPMTSRLLPDSGFQDLYQDMSLAVALAAKSVSSPFGQEVRVIHVPSGEVVFKAGSASSRPGPGNDFDDV